MEINVGDVYRHTSKEQIYRVNDISESAVDLSLTGYVRLHKASGTVEMIYRIDDPFYSVPERMAERINSGCWERIIKGGRIIEMPGNYDGALQTASVR